MHIIAMLLYALQLAIQSLSEPRRVLKKLTHGVLSLLASSSLLACRIPLKFKQTASVRLVCASSKQPYVSLHVRLLRKVVVLTSLAPSDLANA